jgi:acyl-CoA thioesterase II
VISPPADSSHSVVAGIPLELEHIETGMYRGQPRVSSSPMSSIFGGEVVAQALCAAGNTVAADRAVHSLHAYFLRRGDPRAAVLYRAEDIRDGTSFTTRRVVAQQHGEAILSMAASFYRAETGLSHQVPVGDAPPPQATPPPQQSPAAAEGGYWSWLERLSARFPFELRFVDPPPRVTAGRAAPARFRFWMRTRDALPSAPLIHACATAYASDQLLLSTAAARHGLVIVQPGPHIASLPERPTR